MKKICSLIVAILVLANPVAAVAGVHDQFKQAQVSSKGHIPKDGYTPKDGFVPNAATAIGIALVVLEPIYGADQIEKQKPFMADLRGGVWVVQGSIEHRTGTAEVNISKRTGAILRIVHGK